MAEGKLLKAWGAGCAWQLVVTLIISFVLLGALACLAAVLAILPVSDEMRFYLGVSGFVSIFIAMLGGAAAWAVWTIRKRAGQFDAAFLPFGLNANHYLTNGRQYHGLVRGRQVDVYFYRSPVLDMYVSATLRTRVGIGLKSTLSRMAASVVKRAPLETGDPALAELAIYPTDPRWCAELLEETQVKRILPRLMADQGPFEIRNLNLQPASAQLSMHHILVRHITPEAVQRWLEDLIELVQVAESLPPPATIETESDLERRSRTNRGSFVRPAVLITLGIIAAATLCAIAMVPLMLWLTGVAF